MNAAGDTPSYGPWHPGLQSHIPRELRHLSTIYRPENVFTSIAAAAELRGLTGFTSSELVVFRPQRLALHELLIRVTADFAVPDGSTIGDLGINFREIASLLLTRHVQPRMHALIDAYAGARRELQSAVTAALDAAPAAKPHRSWGPEQIARVEQMALAADAAPERIACRSLARVLSALFATHGQAWGTHELIVTLATDMACNDHGGEVIGQMLEPWLHAGAGAEGLGLLPHQEHPIVINTKGASASGKSSLRPLQKQLAGDIGVQWSDFALISPDIWRKQLLDYGALADAYKYAGAFAAEELQIIDQKLDRYMARKHQRGKMSHLLIDRFRFDSFAPDSDEAGSNLLTRFGQQVYLFFMITPPELLVERAWKRGLEFGRYKAVDDTLAHAVEAYSGIPAVFFTWLHSSDKRIQFEFLDNTVRFGERPRTVAFGDNDCFNVLDAKGIIDIERYARVNVDAPDPEALYLNQELLAPEHNMGFLRRCIAGFKQVNFANQMSGRIFLRIEAGLPVFIDVEELKTAALDADIRAGVTAVAPGALRGEVHGVQTPRYVQEEGHVNPLLGQWGRGD